MCLNSKIWKTELPVIRDDKLVSGYIRMEQKKGLIGIYEKANPNTVWEDHCPWEAENELFDADYDRVMPWLENALDRMPIFSELGITREVHGAISHPPDGNPLIGPAPGRTQLLVLLRHPDRYRLGSRAEPRVGPLDGTWGRGYFHARIRPAPLWQLREERMASY